MKFKIKYYVASSNESPFKQWFEKLDVKTQIIVTRYIDRVLINPNIKSIKSLKNGLFEIKINYASGYRVYFTFDGEVIILLLLGGNKSSQSRDIAKAKKYRRNYASKK